jgi:putative DNA primase/helicase
MITNSSTGKMNRAIPVGGAVRLSPSAEVMGVAEGIETAIAAQVLFGLPVWAAMDCNRLAKWEPPTRARSIVVFADNDANFAGQNGAFTLAQRLSTEKKLKVEVRIPSQVDTDWNDELIAKRGGG